MRPTPDALPLLLARRSIIGSRRETLARRLDEGHRRIDHVLGAAEDVREWQEFWTHLLLEYEDVCGNLQPEAAAA